MKISLGYIKDLLGFLSSFILIILFYGCNINPPKILIPFSLGIIVIIDGIFTFNPSLHNKYIN